MKSSDLSPIYDRPGRDSEPPEDRFSMRYKNISMLRSQSFAEPIRPMAETSKFNFRLLASILTILLIPSQILLRKTLRSYENFMIEDWQAREVSEKTKKLLDVIFFCSSANFSYSLQVALFLGGDCLLAYKCTFLYIVGTYLIMLIKFFMGEPRPFWVTNEIDSFYCDIMYSSPDRCCFNIIFFMLYAIYQFQWKFNANQPSKFLLAILYSLVILYSILNAFIMAYFGLVYLH